MTCAIAVSTCAKNREKTEDPTRGVQKQEGHHLRSTKNNEKGRGREKRDKETESKNETTGRESHKNDGSDL